MNSGAVYHTQEGPRGTQGDPKEPAEEPAKEPTQEPAKEPAKRHSKKRAIVLYGQRHITTAHIGHI